MKTVFTLLIALIALFSVARTPAAEPPMTPDALKKMEAEFMHATASRGSQGYMSYYAEDSVELPNGSDLLLGKIAITNTMGFLDDKNNALTWKPIGADVSGDLGYTYGTYEFRSKDKNGSPRIEYGKYTSIWKRQADGSWKVVLDMGNAAPTAK